MMTSKLLQFPEKVSLGFFPTPVVKLARLTNYLKGPEIWVKRDDLTGLALGGNKTRKLEYILAHALAKGCDTVITAGAAQSNHCRQTAAACAQLNLDCHLVLGGKPPAEVNGNLLLDKLFGATIHWAGVHRKGEDIPKILEQLKAQGKNPYVVPYGGSNEMGAYGFVAATQELSMQMDVSKLSHIVFASSSGGTHAGLMLGKEVYKHEYQLLGINIDKSESEPDAYADSVLVLANNMAGYFSNDLVFTRDDLVLSDDYLAGGYGVVGTAEKEAISLVASLEGILLDPVYTGRAMAGLIDMIRTQKLSKDDKVLFWHTGGAPALFEYSHQLI